MKNNFVAKNAYKINKSVRFKDKKKAMKRGECKNKKHRLERYSIAA